MAQFVSIFLNPRAELNHRLEVLARLRHLFGVNRVRVLDRWIGDKAPDLLAQLYQLFFHRQILWRRGLFEFESFFR